MTRVNCLIATLSLHTIWLLLLTKPCSSLEPKTSSSFPAILIFGDSTVDTGNNNFIPTIFKGNYSPYGKNFPGHLATGRFSDGKLIPDMVASRLGIKELVPPFLDPKLSNDDIKTGVSFASAGTGFDDLTAAISKVIPVMKQIDHFKNYIQRLQGLVGVGESKRIISNALVVISAGTNDLNINFYDLPTRQLQYNISGYQDFLQNRLKSLIKEIYQLGCRNIVVAGLPPVGCLPIQETIAFENPLKRHCLEDQNSDSIAYNQKLSKLLTNLQPQLSGSKILYADIYTPLIDMLNNPQNYGFEHTNKGCCGTGLVEAGPLCNPKIPTCENSSKFMFWDSIHPTEAAYKFIAESLLKKLGDPQNWN
ncbi:GDSL esterase/lipase [Cucumis melo var. makuwa]|uniref:GDSL esterase/lipase n=2 Tax=Cucumis melo TaxID=3656 RepID=A0A5A7VF47_CUCMM|nr:GDSL esterase/lipase [Cucumis melo var. makuwa]TYK00940.1 GDSL esterase/lipase [Cucumis melo var. makuwa]